MQLCTCNAATQPFSLLSHFPTFIPASASYFLRCRVPRFLLLRSFKQYFSLFLFLRESATTLIIASPISHSVFWTFLLLCRRCPGYVFPMATVCECAKSHAYIQCVFFLQCKFGWHCTPTPSLYKNLSQLLFVIGNFSIVFIEIFNRMHDPFHFSRLHELFSLIYLFLSLNMCWNWKQSSPFFGPPSLPHSSSNFNDIF